MRRTFSLLLLCSLVLGTTVLAQQPPNRGAVVRASAFRVGGATRDFVATRLRHLYRRRGEGRLPMADVWHAELTTNGSASFTFDVVGGSCYVVLAAGVPSVRDLNLRLVDPYGIERAADQNRDGNAFVRVCPVVAGRWRVEVSMFAGYGRVGAQVFGGP